MKITPTQYEREDGLVLLRLIRCPSQWAIRKINGPAFFFNPKTKTWIIAQRLTPETQKAILLPFEKAYQLFESLPEES